MLRLGYACINSELQSKKGAEKVSVNHSCIAKTFRAKGAQYVVALARSNLEAVLKVLEWNEKHNIKVYRLSSDMFPHLTNPEFMKGEQFAYSLDQFEDLFKKIGNYAREHGHRLTFHPGQYNQIGTPRPEVFRKTVADLSAHAEILDHLGCGPDSVMVVHGGGTYQNKAKTMDRWVKQFYTLPKKVQNRIVIENCERQYSVFDMLELSKRIRRPVVFDTHHHQCYSNLVQKQPDPETFLSLVLATWTDLGVRPKFHVSEQAPDKRVGAHSDYVSEIPQYLLELTQKGIEFDVMIEAKAKEQAVLKLQ
jgi:UV DNA damage endonuclease